MKLSVAHLIACVIAATLVAPILAQQSTDGSTAGNNPPANGWSGPYYRHEKTKELKQVGGESNSECKQSRPFNDPVHLTDSETKSKNDERGMNFSWPSIFDFHFTKSEGNSHTTITDITFTYAGTLKSRQGVKFLADYIVKTDTCYWQGIGEQGWGDDITEPVEVCHSIISRYYVNEGMKFFSLGKCEPDGIDPSTGPER